MLLLSFFLFGADVERLSSPVPVKIKLSTGSSSPSASPSPARRGEPDYLARLKLYPKNAADGLSLVSAKDKQEEEKAKALLDELRKIPSRSAELQKYVPSEATDADINGEFTIISTDATGSLDGCYRVQKTGAAEYYNLVVRNVKTVAIRNVFMAELLKAYMNRKETFKTFLQQAASESRVPVETSDLVVPAGKNHGDTPPGSLPPTPSGAIVQQQKQQQGLEISGSSTSQKPSVEAILKEIGKARKLFELKAIVEKANLQFEPQLDSVRKEIAAAEALKREIEAVQTQEALDEITKKLTERQKELLESDVPAAAKRIAASAPPSRTSYIDLLKEHMSNRNQLLYLGAGVVMAAILANRFFLPKSRQLK